MEILVAGFLRLVDNWDRWEPSEPEGSSLNRSWLQVSLEMQGDHTTPLILWLGSLAPELGGTTTPMLEYTKPHEIRGWSFDPRFPREDVAARKIAPLELDDALELDDGLDDEQEGRKIERAPAKWN